MSELEAALAGRFNRKKWMLILNQQPERFTECLNLAKSDEPLIAWRAAFLLDHTCSKFDNRLNTQIDSLIKVLPEKEDGHQRCLLRVLLKQKHSEDQESKLFDICLGIWEQVNKIPSVRITALEFVLKTAKKYPDLKNELDFILDPRFTETLSPGILKTFERLSAGFLSKPS